MTTSPMQISGNAPLYKQPEPLTPQDHADLGLYGVANPFEVAKDQHFLPLLINEFGAAACNYPIIFAGEEKNPLAVTGLRPGQNLYVDDFIKRGETYLPAYLRRYPFIVANAQSGDQNRAIVCIDRGSPLIGKNADHPFFTDGKYSEYTESCVKFCQEFENERLLTADVIRRLKEHDLFEGRTVDYRPVLEDGTQGDPIQLAGYFAISQTKLHALPVETYIALRDQGILTAIYAHWISQQQWDRLVARAARMDREQAEAKVASQAKAPLKKRDKTN